jgi:hypothetical protein
MWALSETGPETGLVKIHNVDIFGGLSAPMITFSHSAPLVMATLLLCSTAFAEEAPLVLDLTPANTLEHDSNTYQGLEGDVAAPGSAPEETNLLDRNGIDPDITSSERGVGATQRIDLGGQHLAEEQTEIKPYIELGAGVEAHEDSIIGGGSGLGADTNATLGGGTTVSVNDQIDLKLGYTRKEPIGGNREIADENAVETGVSIKF